jgi:hypothetical protein
LRPGGVSGAAAQTTREEQLAAEEAARARSVTPPAAAIASAAPGCRFDNTTGESARLGESNSMRTALSPPRPQSLPLDDGAYVRVDVTAIDPPHPSWGVPVRLYFRRLPDAWKLAGLERGDLLHTRDSAFTSTRDPLAMLRPWSCQSCNHGVFHDSIETSSALRVGDSLP